jgi:hypothetical protein
MRQLPHEHIDSAEFTARGSLGYEIHFLICLNAHDRGGAREASTRRTGQQKTEICSLARGGRCVELQVRHAAFGQFMRMFQGVGRGSV